MFRNNTNNLEKKEVAKRLVFNGLDGFVRIWQLEGGNRKVIWVLMFKSQIWNKNLFGGRKKSLSNLLRNVSFYYESRVSFKVQMKPCSPGLFLEEGRGGVAGEVMNLAKQDAWKTNTNCAFIHELIKICHKNYERNVLMGYGQKIREGLVILTT